MFFATEWIKKLEWYDVSLIKLGTAAIILLIAKYYSPLLSFEWYWYVLVFVLASIHPLMRMFSK